MNNYFSVLSDCPTVSSEESVSVDDDNVCITQITAEKNILEFVHSSENVDTVSDRENEMSIAASVPKSSEMRSVVKSTRSYLDKHSDGEMNNKMDDIEQFDDEKDNSKKNIRIFIKNSNV
ncbi:hypothetical protein TNCV_2932561 [Trichonephila clavipes]|nr:hypothetical protein TNCV_2932561 [Trichonephila clavipes]